MSCDNRCEPAQIFGFWIFAHNNLIGAHFGEPMAGSNLIHYRPLGSNDAKAIHRLQRKLFPKELTEPVTEIRRILLNTEEHMVCNFSFGLFDDTRMVGYVFAWVETESMVHSRPEEVVYLKEIGLSRGYENQLGPLFRKLYQQWQAYAPGVALEAHVMPESLTNWRRLIRLARHYGVTLTDEEETASADGPGYRLLRLDVEPRTVQMAESPSPLPKSGWKFSDTVLVNVLSSANQWLSLREHWDRLLAETDDSNVMQSFDYLWLWWKYHGLWKELAIFVIRDRGRVIGVVPLMVDFYRVYGRTMRNLMFLTSRLDMSRPKLVFGKNTDLCLSAFLGWLTAHPSDWDILDLEEQLHNSLTERLRDELKASDYLLAETETICPYIEFTDSWTDFMQRLPSKMRGNINRLRRRLGERGDVGLLKATTPEQISNAFETHCAIESRSWKVEEDLDLESDRQHYFFHRGLAQRFGERGEFEHRILSCGGKPIASTYGIAFGGVFQSLKIAHDRRYDRYSPGTLLESYEIESLHDSDLEAYEFLGSFVTNKLRWTSSVIRTTCLHVFRPRPSLVLFFFVYFQFRTTVKGFLKRIGLFDRVLQWFRRHDIDPFSRYD